MLHKVSNEGLGEWKKCDEAALIDVYKGILDGAAMVNGPWTAIASLLTHGLYFLIVMGYSGGCSQGECNKSGWSRHDGGGCNGSG